MDREDLIMASVNSTTESPRRNIKFVRNRSGQKLEVLIGEEVVAILPGATIEVPEDFVVPTGIGLYIV